MQCSEEVFSTDQSSVFSSQYGVMKNAQKLYFLQSNRYYIRPKQRFLSLTCVIQYWLEVAYTHFLLPQHCCFNSNKKRLIRNDNNDPILAAFQGLGKKITIIITLITEIMSRGTQQKSITELPMAPEKVNSLLRSAGKMAFKNNQLEIITKFNEFLLAYRLSIFSLFQCATVVGRFQLLVTISMKSTIKICLHNFPLIGISSIIKSRSKILYPPPKNKGKNVSPLHLFFLFIFLMYMGAEKLEILLFDRK